MEQRICNNASYVLEANAIIRAVNSPSEANRGSHSVYRIIFLRLNIVADDCRNASAILEIALFDKVTPSAVTGSLFDRCRDVRIFVEISRLIKLGRGDRRHEVVIRNGAIFRPQPFEAVEHFEPQRSLAVSLAELELRICRVPFAPHKSEEPEAVNAPFRALEAPEGP